MIELRMEGVHFSYPDGERSLEGVDMTIPAGQSMALIGANGSGKSTLLRHLNGLLRPERGRVLVDGADAAERHVADLASQVGLCFQHPDSQIFAGNVRDEVEFGAKRLGATDEEAFAGAKDALDAVGLVDALDRHPGDLGETGRKLLSIASVLAMETPVVALDEPTSGLDRHGVERLETIVAQLHAQGRTVIVVTHDMRFAAESCERIGLLFEGRISLDGAPAQVLDEPSWPALSRAGLEPPEAAQAGARLGLGSTPTTQALLAALEHKLPAAGS